MPSVVKWLKETRRVHIDKAIEVVKDFRYLGAHLSDGVVWMRGELHCVERARGTSRGRRQGPRPDACAPGRRRAGPPVMYTDAGWGCMLRTGQMMLGQALVR